MAAATRTASTANKVATLQAMAAAAWKRDGFMVKPLELFWLQYTVTIKTTNIDDADDEVYLAEMPLDTYLVGLSVTATDMDTHATPTLAFDINIDDGSTEVTLINESTIGQGSGSDDLDADGGHFLRDISEQFIAMKVTTAAATGAEGTLTLNLLVARSAPITESSTD